MINIKRKEDCCGCAACVQICPKQCIGFKWDSEGFNYPIVDVANCIDCGLCEKVCPVINQSEPREPLKVYAAKNRNEEIRLKSSSGGIFTLLAEATLSDGGVVFGAKFNDNWEVVHAYTECVDGLSAFRGSKYVQSRIGDTYKQTKVFLKNNRKVLYSGTPCQIAGLKRYLRKEYDNLITVDFICHGVPSPKVWQLYLDETFRTKCGDGKNTVSSSLCSKPMIMGIEFRDKTNGWKKYGFKVWGKSASKAENSVSKSGIDNTDNDVLLLEYMQDNTYMRGFLGNLYLRPSCHTCPSRSLKSGASITIADYWGIQYVHPEFDDDRGVSLISINSHKGSEIYYSIDVESILSNENAFIYNPSIYKSPIIRKERELFFKNYDKTNLFLLIRKLTKRTLFVRMKILAKNLIKAAGIIKLAYKLKIKISHK